MDVVDAVLGGSVEGICFSREHTESSMQGLNGLIFLFKVHFKASDVSMDFCSFASKMGLFETIHTL